jgi:SAM-dependent MidA family methyltransferase
MSNTTPQSPPTISPAELQRSRQLQAALRQAIAAANGSLRLDDFIQQVLYAPQLGYYTAATRIFGREGDFITAPEIAPLFAQCLARWCAAILPTLPQPHIYEVGAGSGALLVAMLQALQQLDCLPQQYFIVDVSPALRAQQQARLQAALPELLARVTWLDHLPDTLNGIVLANELLDALPVRRFVRGNAAVLEQVVAWRGDQFIIENRLTTDARLLARVAAIEAQQGACLATGYCSEINFAAEDWLAGCAAALQQGVLLLIDYGYPRAVYYHPQRRTGTLVCHQRHTVNADPLANLGLQDITAFVDFTAMAQVAQQAGLTLEGFTTQAHFLLDLGILDIIGERLVADPSQQLALTNQIKRLTMPYEMGEAFKVLAMSKNLHAPVAGFGFRNRVEELVSHE